MRNILFGASVLFNVMLLVVVLTLLAALDSVRPTQSDPVFNCPPVAAFPTSTAIAYVELLIAVQNIPVGAEITEAMVELRRWPADAAPFTAVLDPDDVVGDYAQTEIVREQPVLSSMVANSTPEAPACP